MRWHMHIWKTLLNHIILRLILILVKIDYKNGKSLPHNTIGLLELELETTG